MKVQQLENGSYKLEATTIELTLLSNALNEVCNGLHFGNDEFSARLGGSRKEAQRLLDEIGGLL